MPLRQRQEIQEVLRHERAGVRGFFSFRVLFAGEQCSPLQDKVRVQPTEKAKNMYSIPSAHKLNSRPLTLSRRRRPRSLRESVNSRTFSGRADNACTNLLVFLVRYVRTRGMTEIAGSTKPSTFALSFTARACHAWLVRLTRARGE